MFTKSKNEIDFSDVANFCREFPEGVRVEYKRARNAKKDIPKIVSSFANTLGGIFIIGAEASQTNNMVVLPIQGIPRKPGIEESILQSALMGIYPAVMPEVIVVDVPNSNNIVVVVRVDQSVQAPHAIQNSTRVYIRTGSVTQPYELADIDRIAYMLKRREDSQIVGSQILKRIEERTERLCNQDIPNLTVIASPVFPYQPVISTSDIYELGEWQGWPPQRVAGGVYSFDSHDGYVYSEVNEYGIVYHKTELYGPEEHHINYEQFISEIKRLIQRANNILKKCEYLGNIKVVVQLRQVFGKKLHDPDPDPKTGWRITDNGIQNDILGGAKCFDSEVFASKRCLPNDFENIEKRRDITEELTCQLLWAFNIPNTPRMREKIRKRIEFILR